MLECFDAEGDDSRHIRCGAAGGDAQRNDWTETMRSRALPCFWQVVNIFWWMMFSCWRLPVVQQMPATLWRNEFNKCPDYFLFFSLAMRHWIRCLCWLRSIFISLKWYFFLWKCEHRSVHSAHPSSSSRMKSHQILLSVISYGLSSSSCNAAICFRATLLCDLKCKK